MWMTDSACERNTGPLVGWTVVDNLHKINVPTLPLNGRADIAQAFVVQPFFDKVPRIKWVTFEQCSHVGGAREVHGGRRTLPRIGESARSRHVLPCLSEPQMYLHDLFVRTRGSTLSKKNKIYNRYPPCAARSISGLHCASRTASSILLSR